MKIGRTTCKWAHQLNASTRRRLQSSHTICRIINKIGACTSSHWPTHKLSKGIDRRTCRQIVSSHFFKRQGLQLLKIQPLYGNMREWLYSHPPWEQDHYNEWRLCDKTWIWERSQGIDAIWMINSEKFATYLFYLPPDIEGTSMDWPLQLDNGFAEWFTANYRNGHRAVPQQT